ncbi:protein of unknown function DUF324 [Lachnospiraceae bacterium TWA4]|nr:protein of unknown function DUF324 [Lachnospiraceae bacterium TWA4]
MTEYIEFIFKNTEPLKISDDSKSQSGQTNALVYIPGTTIRGVIVQQLKRMNQFDENKQVLLSDKISFLNAYPIVENHELIPSMKGFYEDKSEKELQNVLIDGNVEPGYKRASLGRYCYVENNRIFYTNVELGSDMKINKGKNGQDRTVFRNQYIKSGYQFLGIIAVQDDNSLSNELKSVIEIIQNKHSLILGGSRSHGYGQCEIEKIKEITQELPYSEYAPSTDLKDYVYMVLLSNTAMVNEYGENVGIDLDLLKEKLQLSSLKIDYCSTSIVDVRGYNRTWKTHSPSVKMYEMGSVFKLSFEGEILTKELMLKIMNTGIGVRNNEGYGRILFFENYEMIKSKQKLDQISNEVPKDIKLNDDEKETLKIVAKGYYLRCIDRQQNAYLSDEKNSFKRFRLNNSQLGTIESILYANLYKENSFSQLNEYLKQTQQRNDNRRVHKKESKDYNPVVKYFFEIQSMELTEILDLPVNMMGFNFTELFNLKEVNQIKQRLIISQIKCLNRGGIGNE